MAEGQVQTISRDARFHTTLWTVVLQAGRSGSAEAREALESLCKRYWLPLYAFARRKGLSVEMAEDLIQEFFEQLLRRDVLGDVVKGRGRFRSFLLRALGCYMSKEWEKSRALKRGKGVTVLSLDIEEGETRYRQETITDLTPEKAYERQWVSTILDRVMNRLREECVKQGRGDLFDRIEDLLVGTQGDDSFVKAAQDLDMTPGAVRICVYRYRHRFRTFLREEVMETVERPGDVDEEIQNLLALD